MKRITLTVPAGGVTPEILITTIVDQWERNLGIDVEVNAIDPPTFFKMLQDHSFQVFVATSGPGFPDLEEVVGAYFHSGSDRNFTGYQNEEVDRRIDAARLELNAERRAALYQEAHRMIVADAPGFPLCFPRTVEIVKSWIDGYAPPASLIPFLRYVRVIE